MAKKVMKFALAIAILLVGVASVASAVNTEGESVSFGSQLLHGVIGTIVYSALGLVVLLVGFKIFDLVTPFSLNKEIAEDNNVAAGVVVAGIMIGLGIIVAAAII